MAAVLALHMVILFAMAGYSSGAYCVCNTGVSDSVLQKNIDYACGNGADCGPINPNGACYNPNTVKDHCNYAVNNYFQKKGQTAQSCSFTGTSTGAGTGTGINTSPSFGGLAPSGTNGINDSSSAVTIHQITTEFVLLTLLIPGLILSKLI